MEYNFNKLTATQKEDLKADIKTLMRERGSMDKVQTADIDRLCQANGLDADYSEMIIKLVQKAFQKKASLKEDSIISKTGADGETSFEAVPDDVANQLNGITTIDIKGNKTTVRDTGRKTMGEVEGPGKPTLNQQDILNLAKDLNVCTKEALRATGNEVAYTQQYFNKATAVIKIVAYFQQNADNPGKPESQEFPYKLAEGKVVLDHGKTVTNIAAIETQSGTANINRDIATDSIKKVISKGEAVASGEAGSSEPSKDVQDKPMMEGFSKAVEAYRKNKSKETIKELFRAAREFPGDDIQHKFQNAVQAYKGIEPPTCSPSDPRCEEEPECPGCEDNCDIHLTESLFIRLLEFAKEDAKDDVDLHEVAENVSRICNEKGCADIDDYTAIMSNFEQEHPGTDDGEQPEQPMNEEIEADNQIPNIDPNKVYNFRYYHYLFNGEEAGSGAMRGQDLIEWLEDFERKGREFKCTVHGDEVFIQVTGERPLTENEPDERERWDDDSPKAPGDTTFYYDPETKKVYDEYDVPLDHGKKLVTGTISCVDTGVEDQSFSHEFGTEYIYVPICTEVDIEIEGLSDDDDFYDEEEDRATALNMLTKDDYDIIQDWGKDWMTQHMED